MFNVPGKWGVPVVPLDLAGHKILCVDATKTLLGDLGVSVLEGPSAVMRDMDKTCMLHVP